MLIDTRSLHTNSIRVCFSPVAGIKCVDRITEPEAIFILRIASFSPVAGIKCVDRIM